MAELLDQSVETPAGDVPIVPVMLIVAGAYLAWFGVHYWGSDTKWPTDPLKAVLTGKPIPTPDTTARQQALTGIQGAATATGGAQHPTSTVGPAAGGTAAGAGAAAGAAGGGGQQTLNHSQLEQLWTASGGDPARANLAAAIAQAESSGRTWITSPNPDGGTNVGLWQLDTRGEGAGHTVAQLQDPTTNAQITVMRTANGTNWHLWETWHTGAYQQFLA